MLIKKITTILLLLFSVFTASYLMGGCSKSLMLYPKRVSLTIPDYFPEPAYQFTDNPLTEEGILLGRKLFYDDRLAAQVGYSCASCHQQVAGFGTYEHDQSHGVFNSHTLRNAPPLFNLAWSTSYHWDGRFNSLIDEAVHPITGYLEMRETFGNVIRKIENDIEYKRLFRQAFQTETILPIHIQKALAQFTGTLISANTKYDKMIKGEAVFTPQEEEGYILYKTHCQTCHPEPLFTDYSFRNIGLPVLDSLKDEGRYRVTGNPADSMKFKVPSLRNVQLTSNYFHDGRFITLSQVLNHYRNNVVAYPNVDPMIKEGISITDEEGRAITAFLRTLTDSAFITNPAYAAPN